MHLSMTEDYYLLMIYTSSEKFTSQPLAVSRHDAEQFNIQYELHKQAKGHRHWKNTILIINLCKG